MTLSARVLQFFRRGAISSIAAAVKAVLLLLLLVPLLLAWIWRFLTGLWTNGWRDQDEEQKGCDFPFPEDIMRRPDPCIYSQTYLMAQGIPVTWDNPDIWMARKSTPNNPEPDSYHLEENTDYVVSVQAHNASSDLAVGVRLRLVYRPWSFNSPDLVPVETDAGGNEVFRTINIPPMGSTIATFAWRTPDVSAEASKHFCLQAILNHPLDINTGNNLGQENTQVYDMDGQSARIFVPLHNPARVAQKFTITATRYAIEEKETVELRLKYNRGRRREDIVDRVARLVPELPLSPGAGPGVAFTLPGLAWTVPQPLVKAKYVGMETLRDRLQKQDVSLPAGFTFAVADYNEGITLAPKETRDVEMTLVPPAGAPPGQRYAINIAARDRGGRLAGGVTVLLTG
ncbi:hypothetical protein BH10PSE7_BH10PSE7_34190 [soil metagenome]